MGNLIFYGFLAYVVWYGLSHDTVFFPAENPYISILVTFLIWLLLFAGAVSLIGEIVGRIFSSKVLTVALLMALGGIAIVAYTSQLTPEITRTHYSLELYNSLVGRPAESETRFRDR